MSDESPFVQFLCVWNFSQSNLNKILKLQKQVVRIILGLKTDGSAQDMFAELGILTVSSQYKFNCVIRTKQS